MSPREKRLLTLFLLAGFVMLNVFGLSYYRGKKQELDANRLKAERELMEADMFQANRNEMLEEMEWLRQHEPEPAENQNVQTALDALCTVEAQNSGLEIQGKPDLLPSDTRGKYFHRAKIRLKVSGPEKALYTWFDRLNSPGQLRAVTHIILPPSKEDDTQISCTATIEQWFVPPGPSA